MPTAIYPGSFDPITLGHVDIIRRLQPVLGEITILISQHSAKKYLFTAEERKHLAEQSLKGIPGVKVDVFEGLTVNYALDAGARVIIRGLRAVNDFEYELVMANMNKKLAPTIETMIVFASPEFYYVASSTVKEVALHGGSVHDLVPKAVEKALKEKFAARLKERAASQSESSGQQSNQSKPKLKKLKAKEAEAWKSKTNVSKKQNSRGSKS